MYFWYMTYYIFGLCLAAIAIKKAVKIPDIIDDATFG